MSRRAGWLIVAVLALATVFGWARPAAAHAVLLQAAPTAGSVLRESPSNIILTFSESVDLVDESLRLFRTDSTTVALGPTDQPLGPASIGATITEPLEEGSYVVAWAGVSADSHPISGAYSFSVGSTTPGADVLVADLLTQQRSATSSGWSSVGRFASYLGLAVLIGTILAVVVVAPQLLDRRRTGAVAQVGGLVGIVGTVLMIGAQAASIGSGFDDWAAVVDTQSGRWWLIRLVLIAVLTVAVSFRRHLQRPPIRAVAAVAALGLFVVVAAGGHAIAGDVVALAMVATVLHLAAMAMWVGGLCMLVFVAQSPNREELANRFSPFALGSVVLLAVSGAINGWRQLDGISSLTSTTYGRWLLVKLAVVAAVLAVAVVVRRRANRVTEPLAADPAATTERDEPRRRRRLRHALAVEAFGMVIVFAATAGLTGATPPAAGSAAVSTTTTVINDGRVAQFDLSPPVAGGTIMHVTVTALSGRFDQVDEITVQAELPERQLGPIDIPVYSAGPNHVTSDDANLPLPGRWTITATARYGEFDQTVFSAEVDIGERT